MAQTVAERQAKYRKSRPTAGHNGEMRINSWVTTHAAWGLKRLAHHYGVTQKQMLEELITRADEEIRNSLEIDSPEWQEYYI